MSKSVFIYSLGVTKLLTFATVPASAALTMPVLIALPVPARISLFFANSSTIVANAVIVFIDKFCTTSFP
jgi:hypothetical protein